jgi:hypothetical protein
VHGFHETPRSEHMTAHKSLNNAVVSTEAINSRKTSHWIHQEEAGPLGGIAHFDSGTFSQWVRFFIFLFFGVSQISLQKLPRQILTA